MKLYTECHWDGWDRIVDIYPDRCNAIPEYINDDSTYKIIILEKGILEITSSGEKREVKAPAIIGLTQYDKLECRVIQSIKAFIIFFKPSVIRDEFTYERIDIGIGVDCPDCGHYCAHKLENAVRGKEKEDV